MKLSFGEPLLYDTKSVSGITYSSCFVHAGGTSDRGYNSMTQEEAKNFSEMINSHEDNHSHVDGKPRRDIKSALRFNIPSRHKKKEKDLQEEAEGRLYDDDGHWFYATFKIWIHVVVLGFPKIIICVAFYKVPLVMTELKQVHVHVAIKVFT